MADIVIQPMAIDRYDEVLALWESTDGIGLSEDDARDKIESFINKNQGMSLVAIESGMVVGAVMCGHDGRRGSIYHLAVSPSHRKHGLGKDLVARCIDSLKTAGIRKCNIFVFASNTEGQAFWKKTGWNTRDDLAIMQKVTF